MVDVIIVHHQTPQHLLQCLSALHVARGIGRVWVVDNNSAALPQPPKGHPPIAWLCRSRNDGFGAACNAGARRSTAPFLLFLNADIEVSPDCIERALSEMRKDERCGMAGVRLTGEDGALQPSRLRFPRPWHFAQRALGLTHISPKAFPAYHDPRGDDGRCDCVLGAFSLVRRSAFDAVHGFDERYFLYFEELDFARRLLHHGYHCRYVAQSCARHTGGASTRALGGARLYYSLLSRFRYALTYWPRRDVWALELVSFGIEPWARLLILLLRRQPREARLALGAYVRAMRELPALRRQA